MLVSKPCFLHTFSYDTRFLFIVKAFLKKWNKSRPKNTFLFFCYHAKLGADFLRNKSLQKTAKIGRRCAQTGNRFWPSNKLQF